MTPSPAFQQWLRSARSLDWSLARRQQSALQAFALLQETCARIHHRSSPGAEQQRREGTARSEPGDRSVAR